jgi:hypothetical protein
VIALGVTDTVVVGMRLTVAVTVGPSYTLVAVTVTVRGVKTDGGAV